MARDGVGGFVGWLYYVADARRGRVDFDGRDVVPSYRGSTPVIRRPINAYDGLTLDEWPRRRERHTGFLQDPGDDFVSTAGRAKRFFPSLVKGLVAFAMASFFVHVRCFAGNDEAGAAVCERRSANDVLRAEVEGLTRVHRLEPKE